MDKLNLKIISAEKPLFDGVVAYAKFPGTEGGFSIHVNHAPFISSLQAGDIIYGVSEDNQEIISIKSGFVEVLNNVITVCVE